MDEQQLEALKPRRLYDLTPIQNAYRLDERHRFIWTTAGRRSRKTLIGQRKTIYRAFTTPNARFFEGAPTHDQAQAIFWENLKKDTRLFWSRRPEESHLVVHLMNGSIIKVVGMDKSSVQRLEGQPWDGFHITEVASLPNLKNVWHANLRPLLADTGGWGIMDGVPDMHEKSASEYKEFIASICGGTIPTPKPIEGAYAEHGDSAWYSWLSRDVLPAKEIEDLINSTDPQLFRQEYEGSFETVQGIVYYGYTPDYYPNGNLDKSIKCDSNLPVYIGMDFNVNPMTAVLGHKTMFENGGGFKYFKGYFLRDSNTRQLSERIVTDFPNTSTFYCTPCQSSVARQTSQEFGYTDLRIIRDVFTNAGKTLYIKKKSKNPEKKDRIAASNSLLYHNRCMMNPDDQGIKELMKDLESLGWKEGTTDIDYSDKMRGHISAAADYMHEYYFPVLRPKLGIQSVPFTT